MNNWLKSVKISLFYCDIDFVLLKNTGKLKDGPSLFDAAVVPVILCCEQMYPAEDVFDSQNSIWKWDQNPLFIP